MSRHTCLLIQRIDETEFRDLAPGEYVHRCQLGEKVWAIIDFDVRIVPGPISIVRPDD